MLDPNWQKGYYYNTDKFPRTGMKLARLAKQGFPSTRTFDIFSGTKATLFLSREIATLTYRGGDEWKERFGRHRIDENEPPSLCPYFMIENYLDYQGENAIGKIDPNTLLYISKVNKYMYFV